METIKFDDGDLVILYDHEEEPKVPDGYKVIEHDPPERFRGIRGLENPGRIICRPNTKQ